MAALSPGSAVFELTMRKIFITKITAAGTAIALALSLTACGSTDRAKQTELKEAGITAMKAGDYAGAAASFKEALGQSKYTVGPEERDICFYLATADYLGGSQAEALTTLDSLTGLDEKDAEAWFLRGSMYLLEGEQEKALSDYDSAIAADPTDYDCYIAIYRNLMAQGLSDKGTEYLNKALGAGSDSGNDYFYRGKVYELLGQTPAAESAYRNAAKKGIDEAKLSLARLTAADGKTDDAVAAAESYQEEKKTLTGEECLLIARVYEAVSSYDKAKDAILAGLAIPDIASGDMRDLKRELIAVYEKLLDFDSACAAAEDYVANFPGDAEVVRELTFLSTRKSN